MRISESFVSASTRIKRHNRTQENRCCRTSVFSGVKRLREQDTRPVLRKRFDSSAGDRRQQAASGDGRRRAVDRTVQASLSDQLRLGDT